MSNAAVHDDELEGLSEEERLALEEEEYDDDNLDDDDDLDGDDDDQDDDLDDDLDDDDDGDDDLNDDLDDDDLDDESGDPEEAPEFQPQITAEPVESYDERMKEISDKIADLDNQFEDGDIDMREYRAETRKLDSEATDLKLQQRDYENAVKNNENSAVQRWQWEQDRFFGQSANQIYKDNTLLGTAFDTAVKQLAQDDANEGKPMAWFLEEADRQVRELFTAPGKGEGGEKKGGKGQKRGGKRDKIPPNLGDMSGAEQPDVGGSDEFAKLDKLEGLELEQALARLSPADQDRYLRG